MFSLKGFAVCTGNATTSVKWPSEFAAALEVLSILSLDLKFISSLFCVVKITFWESMLSTTLTLIAVVVVTLLLMAYKTGHDARRGCTFFVVYFLTFSYPLVSVKVRGLLQH